MTKSKGDSCNPREYLKANLPKISPNLFFEIKTSRAYLGRWVTISLKPKFASIREEIQQTYTHRMKIYGTHTKELDRVVDAAQTLATRKSDTDPVYTFDMLDGRYYPHK